MFYRNLNRFKNFDNPQPILKKFKFELRHIWANFYYCNFVWRLQVYTINWSIDWR